MSALRSILLMVLAFGGAWVVWGALLWAAPLWLGTVLLPYLPFHGGQVPLGMQRWTSGLVPCLLVYFTVFRIALWRMEICWAAAAKAKPSPALWLAEEATAKL